MTEQVLTRELYDALRLDGGWMLHRVDIQKAGTEIIFDASLAWEAADNGAFRLIFTDCRYLTWEVIQADHDPSHGHEIIGFDLHDEPEGKTAVVDAEEFELVIHYGEIILQSEP